MTARPEEPTSIEPVPRPTSGVRIRPVDAVRGLALLVIMMENLLLYLPQMSVGASPADAATRAAFALLVEYRGLPLFSILLGFSLFVMVHRGPHGRNAVARRNVGLVGAGAMHGVLVFSGDILAVYGILLGGALWIIREERRTRWFLPLTAMCFVAQTAVVFFDASSTDAWHSAIATSYTATSLGAAVVARLQEWLVYVVSTPLLSTGLLFPILFGYQTAPRMTRSVPVRNVPLLLWIGGGLAAASVALCAPYSAALWATWSQATIPSPAVRMLAQIGGLLGALSFWLVALGFVTRSARRGAGQEGLLTRLAIACGSNSLSIYLLHSAIFMIVFPPYLLGLAQTVRFWMALAAVTGLWTVFGSWYLVHGGPRSGFADRRLRGMVCRG